MKIIFSRKGFDSSEKYGQVASPIFSDGSMVSLPIPSDEAGSIPYGEISTAIDIDTLGPLVTDLTRFRQPRYRRNATSKAHLDPDLDSDALPRRHGWLPIFGQSEAAQSHLANQEVTKGDLFLFYGWFREVELLKEGYTFIPGAPDRHVIFGWLQIGAVCDAGPRGKATAPEWAQYHAHYANEWKNNKVYIASEKLDGIGLHKSVAGGGVFRKFSNKRCLTAPGQTLRSVWLLPNCFSPLSFTYHGDKKRWSSREEGNHLQTVSKGQEFVIDTAKCPEVIPWVRNLFA